MFEDIFILEVLNSNIFFFTGYQEVSPTKDTFDLFP